MEALRAPRAVLASVLFVLRYLVSFSFELHVLSGGICVLVHTAPITPSPSKTYPMDNLHPLWHSEATGSDYQCYLLDTAPTSPYPHPHKQGPVSVPVNCNTSTIATRQSERTQPGDIPRPSVPLYPHVKGQWLGRVR